MMCTTIIHIDIQYYQRIKAYFVEHIFLDILQSDCLEP